MTPQTINIILVVILILWFTLGFASFCIGIYLDKQSKVKRTKSFLPALLICTLGGLLTFHEAYKIFKDQNK